MDMLMTRFHDVFGCYPISAGCWVLDAHTLRYLHERYGITAACNCKDQWGTDGYTLWGGYWNQAYYPSLVNAYMPAQHTKAQLSVPIFRMLGSDPIYQYDTGLYDGTNCSEVPAQGVVSLEPVYCGNGGGGDPRWVRWFFDLTAEGPSLSFGYAQAGQENSFGWPRMADGFTDQMRLLVERDDLRVETLADSAAWFRQTYPLTPAAAVVALDDWQEHNRRSVWYHSHHYRANLFWEGEAFRLRDLHLFDERYAERYLTAVCTSPACTYDTLPLVDGFRWSDARTRAGLYPVTASSEPLPCAAPAVTALDDETLQIVTEPLTFTCMPDEMHIAGTGDWRLEVRWGGDVPVPVTGVTADVVECRYEGFSYRWHVTQGEVGILAHGLRFTPRDGAVHCRFR
ncbi:MAG: hypothetical protein BWY76_03282 [bacterium ADurb.Bin429]|nr:MAG: hypothetical protein BWY76_03282 [bacterium ADurb.Bin429]